MLLWGLWRGRGTAMMAGTMLVAEQTIVEVRRGQPVAWRCRECSSGKVQREM